MILENAYPNQIDRIKPSNQRAQNRLFKFGLTTNKGLKRPIISFRTLKRQKRLKNSSWSINSKRFLIKNHSKIGNFHLAFMDDEGHINNNIYFGLFKCFENSKFRLNKYKKTRVFKRRKIER